MFEVGFPSPQSLSIISFRRKFTMKRTQPARVLGPTRAPYRLRNEPFQGFYTPSPQKTEVCWSLSITDCTEWIHECIIQVSAATTTKTLETIVEQGKLELLCQHLVFFQISIRQKLHDHQIAIEFNVDACNLEEQNFQVGSEVSRFRFKQTCHHMTFLEAFRNTKGTDFSLP